MAPYSVSIAHVRLEISPTRVIVSTSRGVSAGEGKRGGRTYHFSWFEPQRGRVRPHVTPDVWGPARKLGRIWFEYRQRSLLEFVRRYEEFAVRSALARQVKVRLENLSDEWDAIFVPDEVVDDWVSKHATRSVRISEDLVRQLFIKSLDHVLAVVDLEALVDAAPEDPRRRCFSIIRMNNADELEHRFVSWRTNAEGQREWFLSPSGDLIDRSPDRPLTTSAR